MLRSHKKSHFRHLLFKCANCSFESKQYQALQEHLQIEGHEPYLDESIEEFLKEYSNGNLPSFNLTNNNSNSSSTTPPTAIQKTNTRLSTSKKRKSISNTSVPSVRVKRASSTSSIDSSPGVISPISTDEHQLDSINQQTMPLVCSLCDYVAASKEGLGVHLFQHACKKSDLLNRSFMASSTIDPATKLMELFNGKMGPFSGTTGQVIFKRMKKKTRCPCQSFIQHKGSTSSAVPIEFVLSEEKLSVIVYPIYFSFS
jgi:hypothetical protein